MIEYDSFKIIEYSTDTDGWVFGSGFSGEFKMKIYYVNGHLLECPFHGIIVGIPTGPERCVVCNSFLRRSIQTATHPYGSLFIDREMEVEIE